ncbi:hypothetical protein PPL_06571 [Heterostelium album PN500]|uniref:Ubiquitin-like domain-containing protein n=1 Tax=Heterostelium pallidum (strain ATCC 26659 / Pp 5 / PN500) TaxID=670386 RepID=D3BDI8_HETP5|nr:hypothetical protein PPL_06571 [Heterostelium album PN500]EFA80533.1 hypothetical protein PPL_06571 [Heterostelium album PN500]|eukprot:XP_020432653.1 hypothetical protein PPL_06571 [Heterostelium album PN500]
MRIYLRTKTMYARPITRFAHQLLVVDIDLNDTTDALLEHVHNGGQYRFYYNHILLDDTQTFSYYDMKEESIIETVSNPLCAAFIYREFHQLNDKCDQNNIRSQKLINIKKTLKDIFEHDIPHVGNDFHLLKRQYLKLRNYHKYQPQIVY